MSARSRIRRGLPCGLAAALTLAVAGCGGTGTKSEVADVSRAGAPSASGRLSQTPEPLRLADLRSVKRGSPQATLLRLFYWAQWGSAPNIASVYDRTVRRAVGVVNVVGAYSQLRDFLATSRPRLLEITTSAAGTFVSLELLRADAVPARHSFLLQRRNGRWQIVFDTLLERGLANYVASTRSRNAVEKLPDRSAVRQGRLAAHEYRGLFASTLDR